MASSGKRHNEALTMQMSTTSNSTLPVAKKAKTDSANQLMAMDQTPERSSFLSSPNLVLSGHQGHVFASRFNPSGTILASASADMRIFFWRLGNDCENFLVLKGHQGTVLDIAWSADGQGMYSVGADKVAVIWDATTGEKLKKIREHTSFVNACTASPTTNSVFVTGSDDGRALVWDTRTKGAQQTFFLGFPLTALDMSKDGSDVFVGSIDPNIHVWDLRANKVRMSLQAHSEAITGLSVSPDGSFLLSNSMDNSVRCFDIRPFCPTARCLRTFYGATHDYEKNLLRCSWSHDGSKVAAGSADRFVYIWDSQTTKIMYKLPGHKGSVNDVQFHPEAPIIASASSDHLVYVGELN